MDSTRSPSDTPTMRLVATEDPTPGLTSAALGTGSVVGRYEIQGVLGEGGMGVVYDAYDPKLQRSIALKVLPMRRRGSADAHKRLVREAQSMARLSHPNVITVHDVGLCPVGIYVAMDRIDGMTADAWVAQLQPDSKTILRVYLDVIDALASVHAAGLVHRDIKPSNVMVGDLQGSVPSRVVVMDFGLARDPAPRTGRTDPASTPGTSTGSIPNALTRTGATVGTPAYMAPERFVGGQADPLSDQFSLCVSLYEALYRQRPFAGKTIESIAYRVSQGDVAPLRSNAPAVPASIRRVLLRGLSPQRSDRFADLEALGQALRRASRPSRSRALIAGAMAVATAVWFIGAADSGPRCEDRATRVDTVWSEPRVNAVADALADEPHREPTLAALSRWQGSWVEAMRQACAAESRLDSDRPDPVAKDRAVHCLDRQLETLDVTSASWIEDSPPTHAIVAAVAKLPSPQACLGADAKAVDPIDPERLRDLERRLAKVVATMRTGKFPLARRRAAELVDDARLAGAARLEVEARFYLGYIQLLSGQFEESSQALQSAYWSALEVGDHLLAARTSSVLTYVHSEELVDLETAEMWLRHAQTHLERAQAQNTEVAGELLTHTALLATRRQRFDEAEQKHKDTIALHAELFGPEDVHGASAHHNLASLYLRLNRYDEAKRMNERALQLRERAYGPAHPDVASSLNGLANTERSLGNLERASELYTRALEIRELTLGQDHPRTFAVLNGLGIVASMRGKHDEAVATMKRLAEDYERVYGPDHPSAAAAQDNLGLALSGAGRHAEAAAHHRDAMERLHRTFGAGHFRVARTARNLGSAYLKADMAAEAIEPLQTSVDYWRSLPTGGKSRLSEDLLLLAFALMETERLDEAIALAQESIALRLDGPPAALADARFTLAQIHLAQGRPNLARETALTAVAEIARDPAGDDELKASIETWISERGPS